MPRALSWRPLPPAVDRHDHLQPPLAVIGGGPPLNGQLAKIEKGQPGLDVVKQLLQIAFRNVETRFGGKEAQPPRLRLYINGR